MLSAAFESNTLFRVDGIVAVITGGGSGWFDLSIALFSIHGTRC
jgi:hypothetical protein